jgi:hypothetical protein
MKHRSQLRSRLPGKKRAGSVRSANRLKKGKAMRPNNSQTQESQPRRLRAMVEIDGTELKIYPICDNDADERRILDALRAVGKDYEAIGR